MRRFANNKVPNKLDDADDNQDNDDRYPAHIRVPHLVTIPDGKIAQASGADGSGHGRDSDEADKRNHGYTGNSRDTLF